MVVTGSREQRIVGKKILCESKNEVHAWMEGGAGRTEGRELRIRRGARPENSSRLRGLEIKREPVSGRLRNGYRHGKDAKREGDL